jgi:hypothetical protein
MHGIKPAHESRRAELFRCSVDRCRPPSKTDTRDRPVTGVPSGGQAAVLPRSRTSPTGQDHTAQSPHPAARTTLARKERCWSGDLCSCPAASPFIVHGTVLVHAPRLGPNEVQVKQRARTWTRKLLKKIRDVRKHSIFYMTNVSIRRNFINC